MASFFHTIKFAFLFSGCTLLVWAATILTIPFKNSRKEVAALLGTLALYSILEWSGDVEFTYTKIHSVYGICLSDRCSSKEFSTRCKR